MKIGRYVRHFIERIFSNDAIENLQDEDYSKKNFGISYPFCKEIDRIKQENLNIRYWKKEYEVSSKKVRVTNDWYKDNRKPLKEYLKSKSIELDIDEHPIVENGEPSRSEGRSKARYKGNPIGNAQNLFIRTILSNLGEESFNKNDWISIKNYFNNCCVYCGAKAELQIDHAIPINKSALGEHRLGNIVPSCKTCNSKKHSKDFKKFLEGDQCADAIARITKFMDEKGYVPLEKNAEISSILDKAHKEVATLSTKYIDQINDILNKTNKKNG